MLQFDANAHAEANVDARVNGPKQAKNSKVLWYIIFDKLEKFGCQQL